MEGKLFYTAREEIIRFVYCDKNSVGQNEETTKTLQSWTIFIFTRSQVLVLFGFALCFYSSQNQICCCRFFSMLITALFFNWLNALIVKSLF